MAAINYDEAIVLILFAQFVGNLTPSQADILKFDADLQKSFDATLQTIMNEEGLGINTHNRSLVLGCRPHMPGNTPETQIRSACDYVLRAQQVLSAAPATALTALPSARAPRSKVPPATRSAKTVGQPLQGKGRPRATKRPT